MSSAESADLDHDGFPLAPDSPVRKNWLDRPWMWPLFGLIGLLVFELTTSSGLAVAVFCVKLGMGDVRLGLWLARTDPNRERGTITGLMAASLMGIKVTMMSVATGVVVTLVVVTFTLLWNPAQNLDALGECIRSLFIASMVAFCVSLTFSRIGFYLARRAGLKVWLENGLVRAPLRNQWPPNCEGRLRSNRVIELAQSGFAMQILLIVIAAFAVSIHFELVWPNVWAWAVGAGIVLSLLAYVRLRIVLQVAALHPGECWPELLETHQFHYFDGVKNRRTARLEDDSCWEEDGAG